MIGTSRGSCCNFVGCPLIEARKYEREVLRCAVCLEQYVAPLPEGVADEKFDAAADATIALMRYGGGVTWHRQVALQRMCGALLAESVMWEVSIAKSPNLQKTLDFPAGSQYSWRGNEWFNCLHLGVLLRLQSAS
jgi:hypothetical protein